MSETSRNFPLTSAISDSLQRPLRDLRISVTDRCNLRCTYCMPREIFDENHVFLPRGELLSFEEITRLARVFVGLGVEKIRLTGGEPLLRRGIEKLVASLANLNDGQGQAIEVALTTNALLLRQKADALKQAGLQRLTVSLDSLNDTVFRRMTDSTAAVADVLDGIVAARQAGFESVKVNMVVRRGVNDHEILPMAEHFRHAGIVLRFIEYMDVGSSNGWHMDDVVVAQEIFQRLNDHYPLRSIAPHAQSEVAERWGYQDGSGEIGIIASVTQPFCDNCTRARLSTDGKLYTCLFASEGLDLRDPLRRGASDSELIRMIADCWKQRTDRYSQLRHVEPATAGKRVEMSYIGG